jgi:hypothetical protein
MGTAFIGLLFVAALGTNVPLGMWRRRLRRFSPAWFVAIHASIPVLVAMRLVFVPAYWVIPPEIALAAVGQLVGSRLFPLWNLRLDNPEADAGP